MCKKVCSADYDQQVLKKDSRDILQMRSLEELEREYLEQSSWLVRENANINEAAISMFWYISKHYVNAEVMKLLPPEAVRAHKEGWIHIHKLWDGGWFMPYSFYKHNVVVVEFERAEKYDRKVLCITFERLWKLLDKLGVPTREVAGFEVKYLTDVNFVVKILTPEGFKRVKALARHRPKSKRFRVITVANRLVVVTEDHPMIVYRVFVCPRCGSRKVVIIGKGWCKEEDGRYLKCKDCGYTWRVRLFDSEKRKIVKAEEVLPSADIIPILSSEKLRSEINKAVDLWLRSRSNVRTKPPIDAYLLGYFVADGTYCHTYAIDIVQAEKENLPKILAYATDGGLEPTVVTTVNSAGNVEYRVQLYGLRIYDDFVREGIARHVYERTVPEDFLMWPEEDRVKLLAGIIDAEGSIATDVEKYGGSVIVIRTTSLGLAVQLQILAESLGIETDIWHVGKYNEKQRHDLWALVLYMRKEHAERLAKYSTKLRKALEENRFVPVKKGRISSCPRVDGNKVVEIETDYVYDVEVDGEVLFVNGLLIHNCGGFDTMRILLRGLVTSSVISRPPKHLDSAVDQLANFVMMMANERTGAVGLNAIDLYLAPFVRHDNLSYKQVRQCVQRLIYNLNYTTRVGYQSPFSNITICLGVKEYYNAPAIVGGRIVGKLGDYIEEAKMIVKALCEVFLEGDAYGRPFTFPVATVVVTREFLKILNEDPELSDLFWRCAAERGSFYFLNSLHVDRTGIFSFCCRLTIDAKKVMEFLHMAKGVWVMPPSTGSIGYVSLNLPRIAMEAVKRGDGEKYIEELLIDYMQIARKVLNILRARYYKLHRLGMYPLTRIYIDEHDPFKYYYNTIAVVGQAEMVSILLGEPRLWYREVSLDGHEYVKDIIAINRRILSFMSKVLEEFEQEDHVLYNLEQAPAESASYKFAKLDWERYPEFREFIPHGKDPWSNTAEVFYTSQITPPYTTYRLETQLMIEGEVQPLFTGGVMKHIFVHRPLEPEAVKKLVLHALESYDIVYLSYSPTQSICLDCGYRTTALIWECPKCGSKNIEQWSRIVGYYRPVRMWNSGRRAEFYRRVDSASLLES